jgi:hypothetical protein
MIQSPRKSLHSVVKTSSVSIESLLLNKGPSKKVLNLSYIQLAWQPTLTELDGGDDGALLICNRASNHPGNPFTVWAEPVLSALSYSF